MATSDLVLHISVKVPEELAATFTKKNVVVHFEKKKKSIDWNSEETRACLEEYITGATSLTGVKNLLCEKLGQTASTATIYRHIKSLNDPRSRHNIAPKEKKLPNFSDASGSGLAYEHDYAAEERNSDYLDSPEIADVENSADNTSVSVKAAGNSMLEPNSYNFICSKRLTRTTLCICDHLKKVRLYSLTARRQNASYYRCNTCVKLRGKDKKGVIATVKVVNGRIEGNWFPPHYSGCNSFSPAQVKALELDREARKRLIKGQDSPREAWMKYNCTALTVTDEHKGKTNCKKDRSYDVSLHMKPWAAVKRRYHELYKTQRPARSTESDLPNRV